MASQTKREATEGSQIVPDKVESKRSTVKQTLDVKSQDVKEKQDEFSDWKNSESSEKSSFSQGSVKDPVEFFTKQKTNQNNSQLTGRSKLKSGSGQDKSREY